MNTWQLGMAHDEVKRRTRVLYRAEGAKKLLIMTQVLAYYEASFDGQKLAEAALDALQKWNMDRKTIKKQHRAARALYVFGDDYSLRGPGSGEASYNVLAWINLQRIKANEQSGKDRSDAVLRTTDADNDVPQQGVTP